MNEYIYYLKLIRWAKKCPQGTLVKQTYVKANKRSCLKLNSVKQTNKQQEKWVSRNTRNFCYYCRCNNRHLSHEVFLKWFAHKLMARGFINDVYAALSPEACVTHVFFFSQRLHPLPLDVKILN